MRVIRVPLPSASESIRFSERSRNWRYGSVRRFSTCLMRFPARDRKLRGGKGTERELNTAQLTGKEEGTGHGVTSSNPAFGSRKAELGFRLQLSLHGQTSGVSPKPAYRKEGIQARFWIRWIMFCKKRPR